MRSRDQTPGLRGVPCIEPELASESALRLPPAALYMTSARLDEGIAEQWNRTAERIERLGALGKRFDEIARSPVLDYKGRDAARRVSNICDRLIEHASGKRNFDAATLARFETILAEGLSKVAPNYLRRSFAKDSRITGVSVDGDARTVTFTQGSSTWTVSYSDRLEPESISGRAGRVSLAPGAAREACCGHPSTDAPNYTRSERCPS